MCRAEWAYAWRVFSVERYLARIGLDPHVGPPSVELLGALQLAHLVHVPFENLHAFHRRGVRTDIEWSYPKLVEQQRGGWCFEVNGAFGELLRQLGFQMDYVSCQVWESGPGEWGPPLDHLGMIVHLDGVRWFVDVGFGDCCIQPLLVEPGERAAIPRRARLETNTAGFTLTELMPYESGTAEWEPQLNVSFTPTQLSAFDGRSRYLQTEPGLSWTEKAFATRATDDTGSRITLRMNVLRTRHGTSDIAELPVESEQWSELLQHHFGLDDTNRR